MSMLKNNEQNEKETRNNCWSVYMHINKTNNKKYVGITSRTPNVRWQNGTAYKRNPHFNSAIEKYGWDNFEHIVLHENLSKKDACNYEKYYIKKFNLKDNKYGYNMTDGGEGTSGYVYTEEQREQCRINNSGSNNPCFGRTGKKHPMYGKRGKDNPNYGRKATDEQRKNISNGRKGIKFSNIHLLHLKQSAHRGKDNVNRKPICMCDKDGNIIKIFDSITEASLSTGADKSNLVKCCNGKQKTSMGCVWHYVDKDNPRTKIEVITK